MSATEERRMNKAATWRAWRLPRGQTINRHPGDVLRVAFGTLLLIACAVLAVQVGLITLETDLFRLINYLPTALAWPMAAIMRLGSYPAVLGTAALAQVAGRR